VCVEGRASQADPSSSQARAHAAQAGASPYASTRQSLARPVSHFVEPVRDESLQPRRHRPRKETFEVPLHPVPEPLVCATRQAKKVDTKRFLFENGRSLEDRDVHRKATNQFFEAPLDEVRFARGDLRGRRLATPDLDQKVQSMRPRYVSAMSQHLKSARYCRQSRLIHGTLDDDGTVDSPITAIGFLWRRCRRESAKRARNASGAPLCPKRRPFVSL
jgi:hypothetical protein